MLFECVDRLIYERNAVSEKQDSFHPVTAHEQIAERNDRTCLARAGSHNKQRLARIIAVEGFRTEQNRKRLIVTFDNLVADFCFGEFASRCSPLNQQSKLILLVEALDGARRMRSIVPHPMLITVRIEDDRPLPKLRLQTISV